MCVSGYRPTLSLGHRVWLRGQPFDLWGRGWAFLKKNSLQATFSLKNNPAATGERKKIPCIIFRRGKNVSVRKKTPASVLYQKRKLLHALGHKKKNSCSQKPPPPPLIKLLAPNVRVNSSREHPPRANPRRLKKLDKCPALQAIFVAWQMPWSPFLLWWSNAPPPSPSDQYTKILVAFFY